MDDWQYSVDALNVKSDFYGAKAIIYVEGDDDVLFWREIFSRVADGEFEVEALDGSDEVDKYIEQIVAGHLEAIAARDSDFLSLTNKVYANPRVIYTPGYAIEQSLYTVESILELARSWSKSNEVTLADCEAWINELCSAFAALVHLEAANAISGVGVSAIGDNCTRFMKGQNSATPCPAKIAAKVSELDPKLPPKAKAKAKAVIGDEPARILNYLRGHFLASAVLKLILAKAGALGRKVNISGDSLYAAALLNFKGAMNSDHPHKAHYLEGAKTAWKSL